MFFLVRFPIGPSGTMPFLVGTFRNTRHLSSHGHAPGLRFTSKTRRTLPRRKVGGLHTCCFGKAIIKGVSYQGRPNVVRSGVVPFPRVFQRVTGVPILGRTHVPIGSRRPKHKTIQGKAIHCRFFQRQVVGVGNTRNRIRYRRSSRESVSLGHEWRGCVFALLQFV